MKKKIKKILLFIGDILINVLILFAIVFVIREFLVAPFQVFGPSMCDTMNFIDGECENAYGEYIILNKIGYIKKIGEPKRFDVVVFRPPNEDDVYFIKRVIGLPGDKIEIEDGFVFVNGEKLAETYLNKNNLGKTKTYYSKKLFEVPEGEYLLFGDNRNKSTDARTCFKESIYGCGQKDATPFVKKERIEGKAWVVLWPPKNIRVMDYPEDQPLAEK